MNAPRSFRRASRVWLTVLLLLTVAAVATAPAYTPPSPPTKTWEYFNDNYFSLANRSATNGALIITTSGATQATSTSGNTAYQQQYEVLANLDDWTYRIINRDSGLCLAPLNNGTAAGTSLAAVAYIGAANQKWYLTGTGGGYWAFVHAATGLAMQTDGGNPARVTLQAVNTTLLTQQWLADPTLPVDHFPKKGYCGWDGWAYSFNPSWFYNWGDGTNAYLPGNVGFNPMKHDPNWPGISGLGGGYAALHANPRPISVLAYNEPDHTDQANATTQQQIDIWPQLAALNMPLGSPSAASTWGGWMGDFYNKINSNGYRVDFTAIHNYPTDPYNLTSYLNNVNSVKNTWGRPVWITEFAITGWGANVSWTEEDCWTWLAEFMWRAEDYPNLRRYSYYSYPSTPPANPWNAYGTNAAGLLTSDAKAMTTMGELYASWDADRTVRDRTAYMLQGKQSMMRLSSSTANSLFPATQPSYLNPVSIRVSGAQAQWSLVASPTSGQYYIVSLLDGRRLQTNGSSVVFAAPGTTGTSVQWQVAPDSNGYFFLNNVATNTTFYSHRDNSGTTPTGAYYGVTPSGTATDFTRFRLVKPLAPVAVPTAAPATPTAFTVTPGDRRNVLRWTGAGTYYTVSRATSASGPFTTLVTNWGGTSYVDNTVFNGGVYYYTVTASNLLADTSAATAALAGLPASNLAVADLEGAYKFEAGSAFDNSGNSEAGQVVGDATFFSPGKVDGYAVNFNGTNSYLQLPAVVANDFSVAFWMRTTSAGGTGSQWYGGTGIVDAEVAGSATDWGISLLGGKVAFGVGAPDTTIFSTSLVNDGAWHHVVATRSGTTGALGLYVDGAVQATGTASAAFRAAPTGVRLGALQSGGNFYKGDLDEVRFYSYVVGAGDVGKLIASVNSAQVAQYSFANNSVQDTSGQGNHAAASGITFVSPGKTDAAAANFDGSTSYALLPQSLVNDFTITCWLKTTSTGPTGAQWYYGSGLVDGEMVGAQPDFGLSLLGNKVAFGVGGATDKTIVSGVAVNDGAWHHVAATRNSANGSMRLFIDGALSALDTGAMGGRTAPTALALGRALPGGKFFQGQLDDVGLYNYAMPGGQISSFVYPVPAPWAVQDLGSPAAAGFASNLPNANGGSWSVGGSGADIWGNSDQFALMSAPGSGSGTLVARLASLPLNADGTTNANAKAGLMWRDGLGANAAFVDLVYCVGQGLQFISRTGAGGAAFQSFGNISVNTPVWFKLVRGGEGTVRGYYSTKTGTVAPTDAEWIQIGSYYVPMNSGNVRAGLAVTSHLNGTLSSATFDNLSLTGNTPPTIAQVANQTLAENSGSVTVPVTIGDSESVPNVLALTIATSNPALVPLDNIVLGGAGAARTLQFSPVANQAGTATLTLSVSDGQAAATGSFVVTVTTTGAGGWRQQYFGSTANAGQAADGANPAGDGISNFFKRAFGLNPLVAVPNAATAWPQVGTDNAAGTLGLTYTRSDAASAPDLAFQVIWSRDLQNWSASGVSDATTGTNPGAGTETHQATVPVSLGSPIFLKLQVTRSP